MNHYGVTREIDEGEEKTTPDLFYYESNESERGGEREREREREGEREQIKNGIYGPFFKYH